VEWSPEPSAGFLEFYGRRTLIWTLPCYTMNTWDDAGAGRARNHLAIGEAQTMGRAPNMYQRILLSFDGSVEGLKALREGALLAKSSRAMVFLLSVVPVTAGALIAESAHNGVIAAQDEEYRSLLRRAVARLKEMGIEPTARLVEGDPTLAIAAVAKEINADLVVVGHRAQGFLSRWWSGSRQDYLSDHITCSLLVARNPVSDDAFENQANALAET